MKESIILLTGKIHLLTPALIGSGRSDYTEMDVILDSEDKPFIPATSLIGILKHRLQLTGDFEKQFGDYWGFSRGTEGRQSAICCSDLRCLSDKETITITTRDGIKIDSAKAMVEAGAKYDYQLIEPGVVFNLHMEVIVKEGDDVDFFTRNTATIRALLEKGMIAVGAKTNNGFGKIRLTDSKLVHVIFSEDDHVKKWFSYITGNRDINLPELENALPFEDQVTAAAEFSIQAEFAIKNSLIIRSYSDRPEDPDAVNIHSGGSPVIPGSSLRGALRARAERILNTLGCTQTGDLLAELFGIAGKDDEPKIKGKLMVAETVLPAYPAEVQSRIKIDRFSGGTIEGALFDSMPLFSVDPDDDKIFQVSLRIRDFKDYEAGLLLLLLKDIWIGDLTVGGEKNVGRGVFIGHGAVITLPSHLGGTMKVTGEPSLWENHCKQTLQGLVTQLHEHIKENRGQQ